MASTSSLPQQRRGFTLVELMAGLAIGLSVVVLALGLLTFQLQDAHRQLADLRLTHDLQTIAEVMSRDLARAGHRVPAGTAAVAGSADPAIALAESGDGLSIDYAATSASGIAPSRFGYRLRSGVIEMAFGAGHWQALSDATSMRVTRLEFTPDIRRIDLREFCSRPCDAGACPYQLQRQVRIRLQALVTDRVPAASGAAREALVEARVRNDAVVGGCPG